MPSHSLTSAAADWESIANRHLTGSWNEVTRLEVGENGSDLSTSWHGRAAKLFFDYLGYVNGGPYPALITACQEIARALRDIETALQLDSQASADWVIVRSLVGGLAPAVGATALSTGFHRNDLPATMAASWAVFDRVATAGWLDDDLVGGWRLDARGVAQDGFDSVLLWAKGNDLKASAGRLKEAAGLADSLTLYPSLFGAAHEAAPGAYERARIRLAERLWAASQAHLDGGTAYVDTAVALAGSDVENAMTIGGK